MGATWHAKTWKECYRFAQQKESQISATDEKGRYLFRATFFSSLPDGLTARNFSKHLSNEIDNAVFVVDYENFLGNIHTEMRDVNDLPAVLWRANQSPHTLPNNSKMHPAYDLIVNQSISLEV